jgi:hypothetical protein
VQQSPQHRETGGQPGLCRTQRHLENLGDLAEREPLEVVEQNNRAARVGQSLDGEPNVSA